MTPVTKTATNQSVLVVEDEPVLRRLLVTTLRGDGYEVLEAENGIIGQQQALEHHPRLVLLDIIMPAMNGLEMLRQLREDPWGKTAQIVLLTNLGDNGDIEIARNFGVTDYLIKSDWSLDELANEVRQRLG